MWNCVKALTRSMQLYEKCHLLKISAGSRGRVSRYTYHYILCSRVDSHIMAERDLSKTEVFSVPAPSVIHIGMPPISSDIPREQTSDDCTTETDHRLTDVHPQHAQLSCCNPPVVTSETKAYHTETSLLKEHDGHDLSDNKNTAQPEFVSKVLPAELLAKVSHFVQDHRENLVLDPATAVGSARLVGPSSHTTTTSTDGKSIETPEGLTTPDKEHKRQERKARKKNKKRKHGGSEDDQEEKFTKKRRPNYFVSVQIANPQVSTCTCIII